MAKRGRPLGSSVLREWIKENVDGQAEENQERQPEHSIARARAIKLARIAEKKDAESKLAPIAAAANMTTSALNSLDAFGDPVDVSTIGNALQQNVVKAMGTAMASPNIECEDKLIQLQMKGGMYAMSFKAVSAITGESNIGRRTLSVAQAALELAFWAWNMFFKTIWSMIKGGKDQGADSSAVMTVTKLRYDETPTKCRVDDPKLDPALVVGKSENELQEPQGSTFASHAKILQVECEVGVLLASKSDESGVRYTMVQGQLPAPLFALQETSGQNISGALRRVLDRLPEVQNVGRESKFNFRHSCSDQAQSNMKAEKLLSSQYTDAETIHTLCHVHRLYRCIQTAMTGFDGDVSGMLSFALALANPGSAAGLRQALAKIFCRRLATCLYKLMSIYFYCSLYIITRVL